MRSAVTWLAVALLTIVFSSLIILSAPVSWTVDRKRTLAHRLASWWGRMSFRCIPGTRVTVTGRQHLRPHAPHILVSNHQSMLDIMAMFSVRHHFNWVAKASLFAVPFLGWGMRLAGYIPLVRGAYSSIRQTYDEAKRRLASGVSVFFFPEGTRSVTGELGAFQSGAFKLAIETGVPVVPIAIQGTRDLLEKGSWVFRRGTRARITILPPVDPKPYGPSGADRLRDDTRQAIAQEASDASPRTSSA